MGMFVMRFKKKGVDSSKVFLIFLAYDFFVEKKVVDNCIIKTKILHKAEKRRCLTKTNRSMA